MAKQIVSVHYNLLNSPFWFSLVIMESDQVKPRVCSVISLLVINMFLTLTSSSVLFLPRFEEKLKTIRL